MMLLTVVLLLGAGCTSDDEMSSTTTTIKEVEDHVKSGTWRVTNYNDSGQDETTDYNGYEFTFADNGTLTASNGSATINGTWSVTQDKSDDDYDGSDIDFNIGFAAPEVFAELSDDWDIVTTSTSKIALMDVSGGNGTTDLLTFEKK